MSNETKLALDLFCTVNGIDNNQRRHIESLMRMAYLEGGMAVREEWINRLPHYYGNTIQHHSGAAQN